MPYKLENLIQCLNATQQFTSARVDREPVFGDVLHKLKAISESLNSRRLGIQIFGRFPLLAQGFNHSLGQSQAIQQAYQLEISEIPTISQSPQQRSTTKLILIANAETGQKESHYELLPNQSILIGRDSHILSQDLRSQNAQIIALSSYSRVSSVHAQIQSVSNLGSSITRWQICDFSSNGTYINGQKIKVCQDLNSGDKITLAHSTASNKAPEFVFQSATSTNEDGEVQQNMGEVVCLVVAPQQLLTADEAKFVDIISKSGVAAFLLIVDTSGFTDQFVQKVDSDIKNLHNQLEAQYPSLAESMLLMHLELHPFYQETTQTIVQPATQQGLEWLYGVLGNLASSRNEILAERIAKELNVQIARIEHFLEQQEAILDATILRTQSLLKNKTLIDWEKHIQKNFSRVNEERGDLFSAVNNELRRSSSDFSSPIVAGSLMQKIKSSIDEFYPTVTKDKNQVCIQLRTRNNLEIHAFLLQFCKDQISVWVKEEWNRISTLYAGGLNSLIQNSYTTLSCLPSLTLSNSFGHPVSQIDIQRSLQVSFVDVEASMSFHDGSTDSFGNVLRIGVQGAVVAGMAALGDPRVVIQGASLAASLASLVGSTLSRSQLQNLRLEQSVINLKQNLYNSYQAIARHTLDRVLQDVSIALAFEEKQFRKSLESIEGQLSAHLIDLKNVWEGYGLQKNSLVQERGALHQIRDVMQRVN
jgi:pSer/pThr/pTyr-binding forkhead associated (FHA) protein